MISRILRNYSQVALDFATFECRKYFPPFLQQGHTIGLLYKITWPCEE